MQGAVLLEEHFNQEVPDNSPVGRAAGWHALALFNGVATDYTLSTPNGNYPSLSHLSDGAAGAGPGYLVSGAGNIVSNVFLWLDTGDSLAGKTITNVSFFTRNNSQSSQLRIVVRAGTQWYASAQTFSDQTANGYWSAAGLDFTNETSAWRNFNTNALTIGAAPASNLPAGEVTAIGAFCIVSGTGKIRLDEFVVRGPSMTDAMVYTEQFNESAADPGVIGQAPGWHALAKSGGAALDYTFSPNPPADTDHPNLSLSPGADGNGTGYLVMGHNSVVNPVFVWVDASAFLNGKLMESISFFSRNNSSASTMRIAVKVENNWYLSTSSLSDETSGNAWEEQSFTFTPESQAWRLFNTNTLQPGKVLDLPLPSAGIVAVGVLGEIASDVAGKIRIDEFRIHAISPTAAPLVAKPLVQPGSNVLTGTTVRFSVAAKGVSPLTYQWRKDGVPLTNQPGITGVATAALTLQSAKVEDSGIYEVAVNNAFGTTTSSALTLWVKDPPRVTLDLSGYRANSQVNVSATDTNELMVSWADKGGVHYRVRFNTRAGKPLFGALEAATQGSTFATIARDVDPRYKVTLGSRHAQIGWPYIFFDNADANTPAPRPHLSDLNLTNVQVLTESDHRLKITFSPLNIGPYTGDLTCYIYDGSPLLHVQASMNVTQPWVAYIYDGLFFGDYSSIAYKTSAEAFLQVPTASLTQTIPGEAAKIFAKHRIVMAEMTGGSGTLAVMAPPHTCVYPIDQSDNYGFLQAGKGFIGTKMSYSADRRYRPWVDAPNGSTQKMDVFLALSTNGPQTTLPNLLAYTHGDSFKPIQGHYTMAEHFHPEVTWNDLNGKDTLMPFKEAMKSIGVQMVQLMEFHGPGNPYNNTSNRLFQLDHMFNLLEKASDDAFVFIPGEEYNHWFGGHWSYLFPRRVYFTGWPSQGNLAYKLTNATSGGVTFPVVYQVGDSAHMLQLLREEGGLAWNSHPRIKDTQQYPDALVKQEFYRDASYLSGDWKAMPLDLSKDRLGFRAFQLMNDTAQWGFRKSMLGEVDTFELDTTHEIYAHMNVNYLQLPEFPSGSNWASVVECVREGRFFTTTGEILFHSWNATRTGVTADVEWYFPPAFAEITWGENSGVYSRKLSLADKKEFGREQITIPADLRNANWVRLEMWDVARNGAFTQLHWYSAPANPAMITPAITGFTLIDADTDSAVPGYDPIPKGAVLELAKLPPNLTIRPNVTPMIVDRVDIKFDQTNVSRAEWPYSLAVCNVTPGLRGCPFYDYTAGVLEIGAHSITATPWLDTTAGTSQTLSFSVVNLKTPQSAQFMMDGVMDSDGYRIATNGGLFAAVKGENLYVAAPATDANDQFIFVNDHADALSPAPWGKAGQVAFSSMSKPYLAQKGTSRTLSWSNAGAGAACPPVVGTGWMEGVINLGDAFAECPEKLSIALAQYAPGSGGMLLPSTQIPQGNGNLTIESGEFMVVPVAAIKDGNFSGLPDVLEPNAGFVSLLTHDPGGFSVQWPTIPGRGYRVMSSEDLAQPMLPVTDPIFAGEGVFSLSYTETTSHPQRFYRIHSLSAAP